MASGLQIPINVNKRGGAQVTDEDDQLKKLLLVALRPCNSANPFQQLGISADVIFRVNDDMIESEAALEIKNIFDYFEERKRARLVSDPVFSRPRVGELQVDLEYINMENNRVNTLSLTLTGYGEVS